MYKDADKHFEKLRAQCGSNEVFFKPKDDPRVIRVGKFIRKSSIDELPQLLNVLIGNMSIVGVRPLVVSEYEAIKYTYPERELIKTGLTCYWQVGGRSDVGFRDRIGLDMEYVKKRSVLQDIIIILKTVVVVIKMSGAY
jgi:lipopolysaccharide/colanic/teichoic acid biosynthesis glycosyltransferase